jgi:mannosyltransferase OCH1-like enzyme
MTEKIIHIIYKNHELTKVHEYILKKWQLLHLDCEFKCWNDELNNKFLTQQYPQYKSTYEKFNTVIQKMDFIRCLYLYHYGGIYIDVDVLPIKNMECFLTQKKVFLFCESDDNVKKYRMQKIITNSIMISPKKHPFLLAYITQICENSNNINISNTDILQTTGSLCLTNVYDKYMYKHEIVLALDIYSQPIILDDIMKSENIDKCIFSFCVNPV